MYAHDHTPPTELTTQITSVGSDSQSDDVITSFGSPSSEQENFLQVSQELLHIIQHNSKQAELFNTQQKKMGTELGDLRTQLIAVQKEHQNILKRLKANEELAGLLNEEQQWFDTTLKKLQETAQSQQSMTSEIPHRNNSKVSQLKKKFSGENVFPTAPILRDPGIAQELDEIQRLNVLGNPENDAKSNPDFTPPQHLTETTNKLSHLQEQMMQMAKQISELSEKARTYEEQNKNLDPDQFIQKKLSCLGLSNFSELLTSQKETEERNQKKIAGLERTVFLQWIGGSIITLLLWLQIHRK